MENFEKDLEKYAMDSFGDYHKIVRRGFNPEDINSFNGEKLEKIHKAAMDVKYLLTQGYRIKQATMFVANHYLLSERERLVIARGVATDEAIKNRSDKQSDLNNLDTVYIDGFNAIIPMESLLSNSILIRCQDGAIRDLADLRGSYKIIDKTEGAIRLILSKLDDLNVKKAVIYLDRPVSNSGRLKSFILKISEEYKVSVEVELLDAVDKALYDKENVVSGDCVVIDNCISWLNLYSMIVEDKKDDLWIVDL